MKIKMVAATVMMAIFAATYGLFLVLFLARVSSRHQKRKTDYSFDHMAVFGRWCVPSDGLDWEFYPNQASNLS